MRATCPSCQTTYRLPANTRPGSRVVCKRCGARFTVGGSAPPARGRAPSRAAGRQPSRSSARARRRDNSFALAFGMLVAVAAVAVVAILALSGRQEPPTFEQLKDRLGVGERGSATVELDQAIFMRRLEELGGFDEQVVKSTVVTFYCPVKEGRAAIVLDKGAWQIGRARIKRIELL
ncbi:MAG: zinc-ribbon domain-containing protein [Candidatus Brocadiia bacterium]